MYATVFDHKNTLETSLSRNNRNRLNAENDQSTWTKYHVNTYRLCQNSLHIVIISTLSIHTKKSKKSIEKFPKWQLITELTYHNIELPILLRNHSNWKKIINQPTTSGSYWFAVRVSFHFISNTWINNILLSYMYALFLIGLL